jgi:hypothetical protein
LGRIEYLTLRAASCAFVLDPRQELSRQPSNESRQIGIAAVRHNNHATDRFDRTAPIIVAFSGLTSNQFGTTRYFYLWMPFEMTLGRSRIDQCNQIAQIAALRF